MAPIQEPPEQKEAFTVDGTGTLLLTIEQRRARRLSVSIEKIKNTQLIPYYNFRIPEPSSFWGYLQLVQRDFVKETQILNFRRQTILSIDNAQLEPIEQLRCLIKDSTLLLFDNLTKIGIAQGLDPVPFGLDRANYLLSNGQPRLIPATPETAIYYEIDPGYLGLISIIWQDYASPCANPAGTQTLSSPRSPGGGESGNNGGGGGGTRPATPPPPNRSADPDSDSPAPPPDAPGGPPSPLPDAPPPLPPGTYIVTYVIVQCRALPTGGFGMAPGSTAAVRMSGPATPAIRISPSGDRLVGLLTPAGDFQQLGSISQSVPSPCTPGFVEIISQQLQ